MRKNWGQIMMPREEKIKNPKIAKKIIIKGKLVTKSPLRIGSGSTDDITDLLVLKNKSGKAFIPGTSLAGVLRREIKALCGKDEVVNCLFGYVDKKTGDCKQSLITVSDVVFDDSKIVIREGVGINSLAGTAIENAKFNFEGIERGAEGNFEIEITVRQQDKDIKDYNFLHRNNEFNAKDMYEDLAASIVDVLMYGINVGASTSKGFGKICVKDNNCKLFLFDFKKIEEQEAEEKEKVKLNSAAAWLKYLRNPEKEPTIVYPMKINTTPRGAGHKTFVLEAEFYLRSSLLVRDYNTYDENTSSGGKLTAVQMKYSGSDSEDSDNKDKGGYLIPGSSVKGVIRSCATRILLDLMKIKNKNLEKDCKSFDGKINGILNAIMGSKSLKSRLSVDEIYIPEANLHSQEQTRNRIDRFTGGTIESALFTEKPVWRKFGEISKTFKMCCRIHNCQDHEAGLMLLVLREMWLGNVALGGGKAIGRGVLEGFVAQINYKGDDIYLGDIGEKGFDVICKNDENKDAKKILETYVKKCVEKVEEY